MSKPSTEIICTACGADTLVVRQPVYDGFTKIGESFACATCGHVYASETEVPYKETTAAPPLFSAADKPETPRLFAAGENRRLCRYCAHYVVNPFTQWCHIHRREVEATDHCDRFEPRSEESGDSEGKA